MYDSKHLEQPAGVTHWQLNWLLKRGGISLLDVCRYCYVLFAFTVGPWLAMCRGGATRKGDGV